MPATILKNRRQIQRERDFAGDSRKSMRKTGRSTTHALILSMLFFIPASVTACKTIGHLIQFRTRPIVVRHWTSRIIGRRRGCVSLHLAPSSCEVFGPFFLLRSPFLFLRLFSCCYSIVPPGFIRAANSVVVISYRRAKGNFFPALRLIARAPTRPTRCAIVRERRSPKLPSRCFFRHP